MFLYIVLHDSIVSVGVNANIRIVGETELHDVAEDAMSVWIAGNSMNDMISLYVIKLWRMLRLPSHQSV